MTILALQIGPDGFAVARVEEGTEEEDIRRVPVPSGATWAVCRDLLREMARDEEVTAIGIASSGPIDMSAGVVAPAEIPEWRTGFALVEAVQKTFPVAAVQLALDGVCLGLAERSFGATTEVMDSLAVSVSHRISAGLMVGGFFVVGRTGNAGHFGHVLVPGFEDLCECGGHGCLEAIAGDSSIVRWANGQGWGGGTIKAVAEAAQAGDGIATAALNRAGTAFGRAIASVAPLLDIDLVVMGGSVAKAGPALWKPLTTAVATHARLGFLTGLRVIPSELEDVGVLLGAGVLALMANGSIGAPGA